MRLRRTGCTVVGLLGILLLPLAAHAQSVSTADLAGDWSVTFVSTPTTAFTATGVRAYQGTVTFTAAGAASGQLIADVFTAGQLTFTVSGSLVLSGQGVATGTLTLTGLDTRSLTVREARILANGHTIVGAATLQRPGGIRETGLITLVRLVSDQAFTRLQDLVATWNYHELTPSNPNSNGGDADWTRGKILFHPGGCSAAELVFANGTVREPLGDPTAATFG
jgi:hypothetical protein